LKISANCPACFVEFATERGRAQLTLRVILRVQDHDADPPHPLGLLRLRHQRPRGRCTADERDELAPLQLIESHPIPRELGPRTTAYQQSSA